MKKGVVAVVLSVVWMVLMVGCAGTKWDIPAGNAAISLGIKVAAYNLGYYVGKSKTQADDEAVALAYKAAREGVLSPADVSSAIAKFKIENPQLAGTLVLTLSEMGAVFDATGTLVSLSGIPIEYWDRAAEGYVLGYEMGKAGQKAVTKSAVVQYMPKK